MFEIIRHGTQIDFVGRRKIFAVVSIVASLGTIGLLFTKGLNYGIDFTGGAEVQVRVPETWDIGKVRQELEKADVSGLRVQQIGENKDHQFLVRAQGDEKSLNAVSGKISAQLAKTVKEGKGPAEFEIQRQDVVGPAAGESLRKSGFLSMFYALLCILIYVNLRFDSRYSPGAVIALMHDTLITVGIFILTQKQFDLQILAAILALIGYSNNDTIIVYDRVRETLHHFPKLSIEEAVNKSVNETLGRTILTSLTTFLSVFALWLFGGKVIEDFAFTLMVGIVVGTYSSIFIASNIVIFMTHYQARKAAAQKLAPQRARVGSAHIARS
jgi:preprotein translocase subunit SecF